MSTSPSWDPQQYHRYADLRLRPALDLFSRVTVESPRLVHEIGTGGGRMARMMAARWPEATVVGSDSSEEMLATAAESQSAVEWRHLDIATWQPEAEHDVIFANAVLHWLPGHEELFPRLVAGLRPGGQLAVQMPLSWWQPSHQVLRSVLAELDTPEGKELLKSMEQPNVDRPHFYRDVLSPRVAALEIWETMYHHVLTGPDPVYEWLSGSILRPVFDQLPIEQLETFATECRRRLRAEYPTRDDGTTVFEFHRLFIVATR